MHWAVALADDGVIFCKIHSRARDITYAANYLLRIYCWITLRSCDVAEFRVFLASGYKMCARYIAGKPTRYPRRMTEPLVFSRGGNCTSEWLHSAHRSYDCNESPEAAHCRCERVCVRKGHQISHKTPPTHHTFILRTWDPRRRLPYSTVYIRRELSRELH